jgi:hypothetical protein
MSLRWAHNREILPGVGSTVILGRKEDAATEQRLIEEYRRGPGTMRRLRLRSVEKDRERGDGAAVKIEGVVHAHADRTRRERCGCNALRSVPDINDLVA